MKIKDFLVFLILIQFVSESKAQSEIYTISESKEWFIMLNMGLQMSGIKSEDFVSSNYTPLFNLTVGKWISPYFAVQAGYKGFYFNYIGDEVKHHYNFFYGEAKFNLTHIVSPKRQSDIWSLLAHSGIGYFHNNFYGKPNVCLNLGLMNSFKITERISANIDVSSIIGWDIYQGDEDILPGLSIGLIYSF